MKNIYLIGGTMGVGKTTVGRILKRRLEACVLLDGDWCWDADPFVVNERTCAMVLDNICHLLNNFLACPDYRNVVFCWVMHQQSIIDGILGALRLEGVVLHPVSLICSEPALRARLGADVTAGIRTPDVIERSVARLPLYRELRSGLLDVSELTPEETAERIIGGM